MLIVANNSLFLQDMKVSRPHCWDTEYILQMKLRKIHDERT